MVALKFSSIIALCLASAAFQGIGAATVNARASQDESGVSGSSTLAKPDAVKAPPASGAACVNFSQQFGSITDMSEHWIDQSDAPGTWNLTSSGLEMKVLKPTTGKAGPGTTFSTNFLMQYGSIETKLKSAPVNGIVTAFIWMSPGGDEIDYEWVSNDAQSSYYYHAIPDYSKEGSYTVPDDSTAFHVYRITWTSESITWYVDGKVVRTVTKESTLKDGVYRYPTEASSVQVGIWDASKVASTAQWAHGPVNWAEQSASISAIVESITVQCQ